MTEQSYAESFNSNIKLIARDLTRKFPTDAIAARLLKRVGLAITMDPLLLIKIVGPKLYAHRDRIYSSDAAAAEFALSHSFDEEVDSDDVSHFIPLVQQYLRTAPSAEKKAYQEIVVKLLDDYIEYLSLRV
jgi:hypothetical protein